MGSCLDKFIDFEKVFFTGQGECGLSCTRPNGNIGSGIQKNLCNDLGGSPHERRFAVAVSSINIGPELDEGARGAFIEVAVQRGVPIRVPDVRVRTRLHQETNDASSARHRLSSLEMKLQRKRSVIPGRFAFASAPA
jgi:hypothetical protein